MYHFFSKLGYHKRQIEWLPIFIVRIFLGLFFVISASFTLFSVKERFSFFQILKEHHIPLPEMNAYLLPTLGLICGLCMIIGFLTTVSSVILLVLQCAATFIWNDSKVAYSTDSSLFQTLFYSPEVLYILILFWLLFSGPGKVSFDYRYGKSKRG